MYENVLRILKREHNKNNQFQKEKLMLLTSSRNHISYEKAEICYICKERIEKKHLKDKKYCTVRDHCHYRGKYRGAACV